MESHLYWSEWADVVVNKLVKPEPGQPFLVIADTSNDISLAELCLEAGIRAGADTQLMIIKRHQSHLPSYPGPIISDAISASKVILSFCGGIVRAPACVEARKNGTRLLSTGLKGIEEYAIRAVLDVDVEAMCRDAALVARLWDETDICRVTSPQGTDVSFQLKPRKCLVGDGALSYDGEVDFFPGAQVSIAPVEETINGTIVADAVDSRGYIKTPYALTMKNGYIVDVQGGREAEDTKNWMESCKDEKVYRLCHYSFGLNPVARATLNAHESERVMAAVDFGFGYQEAAFGGTIGFSPYHWDLLMATPAVFLDGKQMSGGGKLNHELGFEVTTSRAKRL